MDNLGLPDRAFRSAFSTAAARLAWEAGPALARYPRRVGPVREQRGAALCPADSLTDPLTRRQQLAPWMPAEVSTTPTCHKLTFNPTRIQSRPLAAGRGRHNRCGRTHRAGTPPRP
jgi:hypothetical protein